MKIGNTAPETHYKDTDVDHGRKYCYRIRAITAEGTSDAFETDDIQAGTKGDCILHASRSLYSNSLRLKCLRSKFNSLYNK